VADLKVFRIERGIATEIPAKTFALERQLQQLLEANMETVFGVRFLQTEYITGKVHAGRIDSLGLDENGSPVIFEYKRTSTENVINQGLFYLDWLMDHKGEFQLLVSKKLGVEVSENIEWSAPRLICVANDFTRYDEHAVRQINRNVELVRYRDFGTDLLAIELVTSVTTEIASNTTHNERKGRLTVPSTASGRQSVSDLLAKANPGLVHLYERFETLAFSLGEDVIKNERSNYFAFRRLKNFACVEVHPSSNNLLVYLKVDPATVAIQEGFSRDMTSISHFGTGDLELRVSDETFWSIVEELTTRAYAAN
jgi:predicted transport protein